ncbi:MAG: hypothetical protein J7M13_08875, partial [Synergistetes bacterium]|nr:hypothetical protein [Synergistota bacterium]
MRGSLKIKIMILVLVSVLVPTGIAIFMSIDTSGKIVESLEIKSFKMVGDFLTDKLNAFLKQKVESVKGWSGKSEFLNALALELGESAIWAMNNITRADPSFGGFQLYKMDGTLIATNL